MLAGLMLAGLIGPRLPDTRPRPDPSRAQLECPGCRRLAANGQPKPDRERSVRASEKQLRLGMGPA